MSLLDIRRWCSILYRKISGARKMNVSTSERKGVLSIEQSYDHELTDAVLNISALLEDDAEIKVMVADCKQDLVVSNKKAPRISFYNPRYISFAITALFVISFGAYNLFFGSTQSYETSVGEQREIVLQDGSKVILNTDSKISVEISDSLRKVQIEKGEVFFNVVGDRSRDFVVHAVNGITRVVGTQFNINLAKSKVTVSVVSGIVEVNSVIDQNKNLGVTKKTALLNRGQAVTYSGLDYKQEAANLDRIAAWRQGQMRFDAVPLEQAIAEHNRYSERKIVLIDDELNEIKVNGVFEIGDTDSFLFALKGMFDISMMEKDNRIGVMKKY